MRVATRPRTPPMRRRAALLSVLALAATAPPAAAKRHHHTRRPLFLVHGSFVGGWVWHYPGPGAPAGVAGLLKDAGYDVHTPTLPGHEEPTEKDPRYTPARAAVTTAACVDALVDYVRDRVHADAHAVVVAHSYGGIYLQELLSASRDRLPPRAIGAAVWANAWVLKPGESFVNCSLTGYVDRILARVPVNRFPPSHPISRIEAAAARRLYFSDADPANASAIAADVYARSVYEAMGPAFDRHELKGFKRAVAGRHAPTLGYVRFTADATGDASQWMGFAGRLDDAAGAPVRVAAVEGGGHVSMVTRPAAVARAILEVIEPKGGCAAGTAEERVF